MKQSLIKIINTPWYFFCFAIYPPLALMAYNINELRPVEGLRSVILSAVFGLILFGLFWFAFRSKHRASFIASILLLLFFSYGHVFRSIIPKWEIPHLDILLPITWIILASLAVAWLARRKTHVRKAALSLNLISAGMVLTASIQIIMITLPRSTSAAADNAQIESLHVQDEDGPPDIYYIVIDSYGRSDLLKRSFQIDNSNFISDLEGMGFYVASCSQSNYNRTDVSLASSMNMDYLQNLDDSFQPPNQGRARLWNSILHSAVRADLEKAGYKSIAFATGFPWTEMKDSDMYLTAPIPWWQLNSFETLMLRTTPLRYLENSENTNPDILDGRQFRQRTDFIFNSVSKLVNIPGPKFVFIHIIPPHPPFVYAPDGSWTDPAPFLNEDDLYTAKKYTEGYTNQLAYVDDQIEIALQTILDDSISPPIIILQGDHAPWLQSDSGKFMILNALLLPGQDDLLYPSISPVNTFRLIFNTYFEADYPILEDISYYSPTPNIYDFVPFPNACFTGDQPR